MSQLPKPEELLEQAKKALVEAGIPELPAVLKNSLEKTSGQLLTSTTTLAELNEGRPSEIGKLAYVRNALARVKAQLELGFGLRDDINVGKTVPWLDGRDHRA